MCIRDRHLKILPFARYLRTLEPPITTCVGVRADEHERANGDYFTNIPGVKTRFPLREWEWQLQDVLAYLKEKRVTIPKRTDCALCFYQRIGEWWDLWREYPTEYEKGVQIENRIGRTFRSPSRDTWPAGLKDLRVEFESGRVPRGRSKDNVADMKCRVCTL